MTSSVLDEIWNEEQQKQYAEKVRDLLVAMAKLTNFILGECKDAKIQPFLVAKGLGSAAQVAYGESATAMLNNAATTIDQLPSKVAIELRELARNIREAARVKPGQSTNWKDIEKEAKQAEKGGNADGATQDRV